MVEGSADVTLEEDDGVTVLRYKADFKVGGKLAQVGSRLVLGATRKIADDFFSSFSTRLDPGAQKVVTEEEVAARQARASFRALLLGAHRHRGGGPVPALALLIGSQMNSNRQRVMMNGSAGYFQAYPAAAGGKN